MATLRLPVLSRVELKFHERVLKKSILDLFQQSSSNLNVMHHGSLIVILR